VPRNNLFEFCPYLWAKLRARPKMIEGPALVRFGSYPSYQGDDPFRRSKRQGNRNDPTRDSDPTRAGSPESRSTTYFDRVGLSSPCSSLACRIAAIRCDKVEGSSFSVRSDRERTTACSLAGAASKPYSSQNAAKSSHHRLYISCVFSERAEPWYSSAFRMQVAVFHEMPSSEPEPSPNPEWSYETVSGRV
jgi:hypothetical protein